MFISETEAVHFCSRIKAVNNLKQQYKIWGQKREQNKKHAAFQRSHANQASSLLELGDEATNDSQLILTTSELRKYWHAL